LSVTSIYSNRRLRAIPTPIKPRYFYISKRTSLELTNSWVLGSSGRKEGTVTVHCQCQ